VHGTPAVNNYIGTECTLPNGLKVFFRQGDLVNETTDVIVNPANRDMRHGGGGARVIASHAGSSLVEECKAHIQEYGSLEVGEVVHTTAGNLRRVISFVLHAVGPDAREIRDEQSCAELVQRTICRCLEYTDGTLKVRSIAIPAVGLGIFMVPITVVALAMYLAVSKFDQAGPKWVREVHIVNLDARTTDIMGREFAWWSLVSHTGGKLPN